jgi:hypothetical protein
MCAGVRFEIFFGCFVHGKGENGRREAKSFFPFLRKQKKNAFVHFSLGPLLLSLCLLFFSHGPSVKTTERARKVMEQRGKCTGIRVLGTRVLTSPCGTPRCGACTKANGRRL